jgi:hypothetical protein
MKKLGMDEKDVALDRSELYIKESSQVAAAGTMRVMAMVPIKQLPTLSSCRRQKRH